MLKPFFCRFCFLPIAAIDGDKIVFPLKHGYDAAIWLKKARYVELQCGNCKEISIVRNPRFQNFVDKNAD